MRKFILSAAVAGIFLIYSLGIRHELPKINKPAPLAGNTASPPAASTSGQAPATAPTAASAQYKDGSYTGSVADAYYGNVQVLAVVSSGKITDVKFLQYPNTHSTSVEINSQAMPYLKQEAVKAQSSNVQIISGATFTSQAFVQSLATALSQAKA